MSGGQAAWLSNCEAKRLHISCDCCLEASSTPPALDSDCYVSLVPASFAWRPPTRGAVISSLLTTPQACSFRHANQHSCGPPIAPCKGASTTSPSERSTTESTWVCSADACHPALLLCFDQTSIILYVGSRETSNPVHGHRGNLRLRRLP